MTKEVVPLAFEECFEAFRIMAEETTRVFEAPSTPQQRLLTTGSYLLTCALATDRTEPDKLKTVFALGLQTAGMDTNKAIELADTFDSTDAKRLVFSLAYVRPDQDVPGVVRRKKSVTLNESLFVRAIIQKRNMK